MAATKPDRRTERTRQALMMAFVGEVLSRGYVDVSVDDIAARANVGRSTFYMHYKSKLDLLKQSLMRPSGILSAIVGHDVTPEMLVPQLMHFHEQRTINRPFFSAPIREVWVKCLAQMIEPRLATLIRQSRANPALPADLIAVQIAEAQISLIANWLTARPSLTPDTVAQALIATTRANLAALLRARPDAPLFIVGEKLRIVRV